MDATASALINGYVLQATSLDVQPDMHMDFCDATLHISVLPSGLFWFGIDENLFQQRSLTRIFRRGDIAVLRIIVGNEHILRCCYCDGIEQKAQAAEPRRCCIRLRYDQRYHWKASVERVAERSAKSRNRNAQLFLADWLDDYGRPYEADSVRRSIAKQQGARKTAVRRSRR